MIGKNPKNISEVKFQQLDTNDLDSVRTTIVESSVKPAKKTDWLGCVTDDEDSSSDLLYSTQTFRRLKNRHVQLIAISGVIGTALFVAIGKALYKGGPAFLLIAFALWCVPILCITVSTAEMVCFLPVSSPFLRLAARCADDSLAVMASWNFWFLQCVQIPFEIVSVNTIIHYWRDDYCIF